MLLRRRDRHSERRFPHRCGAYDLNKRFVEPRPYANPEAAARKLLELANAFVPIQDGRIYIEKINGPMLSEHKATPAEYKAALDLAIANGWLELHESGT